MSTLEIREATPEEYAEAGRVTALAYREFVPPDDDGGWSGYLEEIADVAGRADRTTILVAILDGRVVGSLTLELDGRVSRREDHDEGKPLAPGEAHVRMLGVDPDARGLGIGPALMRAAMELSRERGKTFMTLHTTSRMRTAQRMYEAMGFARGPDWQVSPDFALLSYSIELGSTGGTGSSPGTARGSTGSRSGLAR